MDKVCIVKTAENEVLVVSDKGKDSMGRPIKRRVSNYILQTLYRDSENLRYFLGVSEPKSKEISESVALKLVKETLAYQGKNNSQMSCIKYLTQHVKK